MEIDITSLLDVDQFERSHSRMEGGENAGQNTWLASLEAAAETVLLDTEEKLQAMRDFARSSGGWDEEEVNAWSGQEVNALFLQWIAGDCREAGADSLAEIDWEEYRADCEAGQCAGRIYRGDIEGDPSFGRIFFSLSE